MPINAQSRWVSAIELSMSVAVSVRNYLQGKYWNMQLYAVHWCSSYICSLQCCMWGVIMTNPLQSAQSHPQHREANNIFTPRNMQQTLDKCFQFKWNKLIMSMYLKMFKYFLKILCWCLTHCNWQRHHEVDLWMLIAMNLFWGLLCCR